MYVRTSPAGTAAAATTRWPAPSPPLLPEPEPEPQAVRPKRVTASPAAVRAMLLRMVIPRVGSEGRDDGAGVLVLDELLHLGRGQQLRELLDARVLLVALLHGEEVAVGVVRRGLQDDRVL